MTKKSKPKELTAFDDIKEVKKIVKIMKKIKATEIEIFSLGGKILFRIPKTEFYYISGRFTITDSSRFFKYLTENDSYVILNLDDLADIAAVKKADAIMSDIIDNEFRIETTSQNFVINILPPKEYTPDEYTNERDLNINSDILEEYEDDDKIIEIHTKKVLVLIDGYDYAKLFYNQRTNEFRKVGVYANCESSLAVILTQHFKTI